LASTTMLFGQVMDSGAFSVTVILKEQLWSDAFGRPSIALKVFVVTPSGKVFPLGRPANCSMVTFSLPQLSDTVGSGK